MEYAEGNLPPTEAVELERHLTSCNSCRAELESWRQLEARLRAFPLVAEPADLKATVMSRVAASRPAPVPVAYRPVDPAMAVALGLILVGLGVIFSGGELLGNWELRLDSAYWLVLVGQAVDTGLEFSRMAAGELLRQAAQMAYVGLTESAPVLMAALLLALFAVGPREILSAVGITSRER